jgi:predicted acyl esterase
VVRYDIEIFPTDAQIAAGHRLRLTITPADIPHLLPSANQSQSLAGGVYQIERDRSHASYLEVPVVAGALR